MEDNKMLDELYRQKYLKYKAKYLELRDQSGGIWPFGKKESEVSKKELDKGPEELGNLGELPFSGKKKN